jgi:hypothetical protein
VVAVLKPATTGAHPDGVGGAAESLGSLGEGEPTFVLADEPFLHKPVQLITDNLADERAQSFPYPVLELAQGAVCSSAG